MPAKQIVRIILGEEKTTKKGMNKQKKTTKEKQATNGNKQTKTQSVNSQQLSSLINITAI